VHPTGGIRPVKRSSFCAQAISVKSPLSRLAHPQVTHPIGWLASKRENMKPSIPRLLIAVFITSIFLSGCIPQGFTNFNQVATPTEVVLPKKVCPPLTTSSVKTGSHIGLRMPSELVGFERSDSFLFLGISDYSYQISHVVENQEQHYFWIERICDDENGKEQFEVMDEIILPSLKDGEFASANCLIVGDINILTFATGSYQKGITQAWTLDSKNWKFEDVPAEQLKDISCH